MKTNKQVEPCCDKLILEIPSRKIAEFLRGNLQFSTNYGLVTVLLIRYKNRKISYD